MAKLMQQLPAGKDQPINIGVQPKDPNIKAAENSGEQAASLAQRYKNDTVRFSKHGTFFGKDTDRHPLSDAWEG